MSKCACWVNCAVVRLTTVEGREGFLQSEVLLVQNGGLMVFLCHERGGGRERQRREDDGQRHPRLGLLLFAG